VEIGWYLKNLILQLAQLHLGGLHIIELKNYCISNAGTYAGFNCLGSTPQYLNCDTDSTCNPSNCLAFNLPTTCQMQDTNAYQTYRCVGPSSGTTTNSGTNTQSTSGTGTTTSGTNTGGTTSGTNTQSTSGTNTQSTSGTGATTSGTNTGGTTSGTNNQSNTGTNTQSTSGTNTQPTSDSGSTSVKTGTESSNSIRKQVFTYVFFTIFILSM